MEEKVAAVVNIDVRVVTPDALWELGLNVKTLVGKVVRLNWLFIQKDYLRLRTCHCCLNGAE